MNCGCDSGPGGHFSCVFNLFIESIRNLRNENTFLCCVIRLSLHAQRSMQTCSAWWSQYNNFTLSLQFRYGQLRSGQWSDLVRDPLFFLWASMIFAALSPSTCRLMTPWNTWWSDLPLLIHTWLGHCSWVEGRAWISQIPPPSTHRKICFGSNHSPSHLLCHQQQCVISSCKTLSSFLWVPDCE